MTGAGGFIGSRLTAMLAEAGANVTAIHRYTSRNSIGNLAYWITGVNRNRIKSVHGDIRDPRWVRENLDGSEIVFHLAALIGIPYSYTAPLSYVDVNIAGTVNILEACNNCGVERLVHTSTSECYGTAVRVPIDEDHPLQAQSPYAATKIAADKIIESYWLSFGQSAVTVRPFNTFGPGQSPRAVIPTVILQLLKNKGKVKLGAVSPVRDWVYIDDTARGFMLAGMTPGVEGRLFNLASGSGRTVGEMADLAAEVLDIKMDLETEESRVRPAPSEVMRLIGSADAAKKALGWQPEVNFKDGLKQTAAFYRKYREDFNTDGYRI
ncbi:GDP-mannose 4,6-dehydratase [Calditrichota bacterium]